MASQMSKKSVDLRDQFAIITGYTRWVVIACDTIASDTFCTNARYMQIFVGFSAQSRCNQVQDMIDAKLDRRRKGVYGPGGGKK